MTLKEIFEKMAISPERKIILNYCNNQELEGIITLSDIFNILNLELV